MYNIDYKNLTIYRKKTNNFTYFSVVIILFCLGCMFAFSTNKNLNILYRVLLFFIVALFIYTGYKFKISKFGKTIGIIAAIMVVLRISSIKQSDAIYSIKAAIQIGFVVSILFAADKMKIGNREVDFFNVILFLLCVLGIIDYCMSPDKIFFTVFGSMNTFGGVFAFLLSLEIVLIQFNMRKPYIINLVACTGLILLSSSRTPLLMLMVFVLVLFMLKTVFKSHKAQKLFFILFIAVITIGTYFYINISKWSLYEYFNELSLKYFGKNIDSGRPAIWLEAFKTIKNRWFFGVGHIEFKNGISGHNQFVQLIGDNGVVGLLLFITFLGIIWYRLSIYGKDKTVRVCMALMASFLVYNCFEVTLLQNKFAIGCIEWLIIGIGLGRCSQLKKRALNLKNKINGDSKCEKPY